MATYSYFIISEPGDILSGWDIADEERVFLERPQNLIGVMVAALHLLTRYIIKEEIWTASSSLQTANLLTSSSVLQTKHHLLLTSLIRSALAPSFWLDISRNLVSKPLALTLCFGGIVIVAGVRCGLLFVLWLLIAVWGHRLSFGLRVCWRSRLGCSLYWPSSEA